MKKSLIRKIAFLSMMLMGTSLLFAQSEDGFQAEQAEAPVTEEHDIRDDPDYKYFAHDSNGNYVRDGAGNRVRVGRPITNPNQIQYVQHTRNLIEIEKDDIHLILDGDAGTFGLYTVAETRNTNCSRQATSRRKQETLLLVPRWHTLFQMKFRLFLILHSCRQSQLQAELT